MRIYEDPAVPPATGPTFTVSIKTLFSTIARQLNGVTEGRIAVSHGAMTAAPTTGDWAQGDIVRNSTPTELGSGGSKYVITGWICTASGTPGTWLPMRTLTGN